MKTLCVLVFMLVLPIIAGLSQKKTILIIESYHKEYQWDHDYLNGIMQTLGNGYTYEFFEMDTKRLPKSQNKLQADRAWKKYQELNPVLVFLGDDNALKFLGPRFVKTTTPVVYLGINNNPMAYIPRRTKNITGVLERPLYKRSVLILRKIFQKKLQKVLFLFDESQTSQALLKESLQQKSTFKVVGVQTDLKLVRYWHKWQEVVLNAKKNNYDAIIVGLYFTLVDEAGKSVDSDRVIRWTSKNIPVKSFAFWDFAVGKEKTIGGLVTHGKRQGELAGQIAQRILTGTEPAKIYPIRSDGGRLLFSKSKLKEYKIVLPLNIRQSATYID